MSNMSNKLENYNTNETIATGLYRPKTTALLFDKLWVPADMIARCDTPAYEEDLASFQYSPQAIPKQLCVTSELTTNMLWRQMGAIQGPVFNSYYQARRRNEPLKIHECGEVKNSYSDNYLFSVNRNEYIMRSTITFKSYMVLSLFQFF